jgi:hypothetical protein
MRTTTLCTRSRPAHYPLFSHRPTAPYKVTLADVEAARDACRNVADPRQRAECYVAFGIDVEKVDAYFAPVARMELQMVKAYNE